MVDFTDFKIGSKIKLKLSDDTTQEYVIVIVDEIEWSLHRHPFLVDLKIESSTDEEKWPLNTTMLLNVKIEEDKNLLKCPNDMHPNREITCRAAFKLEQIIMN